MKENIRACNVILRETRPRNIHEYPKNLETGKQSKGTEIYQNDNNICKQINWKRINTGNFILSIFSN